MGDTKQSDPGEAGEEPLKILHVVPRLANSSGPTHIVNALAEAQARLGHSVKVFTVTRPGEQTALPDAGLVQVESFPQTWGFRNFCYSRPFGRALPKAVAEADVVHVHTIWTFPTWRAMQQAATKDVPYVVAPQGSFEDWALARSRSLKAVYGRFIEGPLFDEAARFQALTGKEAKQCRNYGVQAEAVVIANPVDVEFIDGVENDGSAREELGVANGRRIVLFLGRLFPKKGLELLAETLKRVGQERDDVMLVVAGNDAGTGYRETVEKAFKREGVIENVRFVGEVSGEKKFQLYKAADVFVLPSYSEGLPVAVLEAMAAGVATVITPGCNLPEMIEAEAGWVAELEAGELSAAVLEALEDCEGTRARVQRARKLVEEKYSSAEIARQTIAAYRDIRNERESTKRGRVSLGTCLLRGVALSLWTASLVLAAVVLYLSWTADSHMTKVKWIPEWLSGWADSGGDIETMRTGVPLAAVGLLFTLSLKISGLRHWVLGGIGIALILVLVAEGGQFFLPERGPSWGDVWWGAVGAGGGVVIGATLSAALWLGRRLRRKVVLEDMATSFKKTL